MRVVYSMTLPYFHIVKMREDYEYHNLQWGKSGTDRQTNFLYYQMRLLGGFFPQRNI